MPCPPVICRRPSDEIFSSIQLSAVEPAKRFRSQATIASHRESAFAIVNPSAAEGAQIQILARDRNGQVFDSNELTLAPGARVSLLLWQLLLLNKVFIVPPERPDNFHGSLEISSDVPVGVGGIQVLLPEGKLVNLPVRTLPAREPIALGS